MKVRKAVRVPHPDLMYSTVEVSLEIDTTEFGIEVSRENYENVFETVMDAITDRVRESLVASELVEKGKLVR